MQCSLRVSARKASHPICIPLAPPEKSPPTRSRNRRGRDRGLTGHRSQGRWGPRCRPLWGASPRGGKEPHYSLWGRAVPRGGRGRELWAPSEERARVRCAASSVRRRRPLREVGSRWRGVCRHTGIAARPLHSWALEFSRFPPCEQLSRPRAMRERAARDYRKGRGGEGWGGWEGGGRELE